MRNIFIVNATQVVVSEANPQGTYTPVNGYPIRRDSRDYERTEENPNGNADLALIVAQADYADAVKALSIAHNRAGWAVTLTNKQFFDKVIENMKSYVEGMEEHVVFEKKTDEERMKETIEALDEQENEDFLKSQEKE